MSVVVQLLFIWFRGVYVNEVSVLGALVEFDTYLGAYRI